MYDIKLAANTDHCFRNNSIYKNENTKSISVLN